MNNSQLALKKGASYAEALQRKVSSTTIDINNKTVRELSQGESELYAVRLLYKGSWGIAYSSKPEFQKLTAKAVKNARTLRQNIKIRTDKASHRRKLHRGPKRNRHSRQESDAAVT